MLLFKYEVRGAFKESPIKDDIFAETKADAFNQIIEKYTSDRKRSVSDIQIVLYEVA